jgi:hypothetical protein
MGDKVALAINANTIDGFDANQWSSAFLSSGYPNLARNVDGKIVPKPADVSKVGWVRAELILISMVSFAAVIYGASGAFMAEMFPTRLRYTSLSLPFHVGAGWFGGPLLATAFAAGFGDIYAGLWYPIGVTAMTAVLGFLFLRDTKGVDIASGLAWKV